MRFLEGFYFNAGAAVLFLVYSVGFFSGRVETDYIMSGMMALALGSVCFKDAVSAHQRRGER